MQHINIQTVKPYLLWCGSEGDGDGSGSGGEGAPSGDAGNGSGDGSQQQPSKTEAGQGEATVSRADFEALEARMRAADQAKSAAETRVKEFEDANKSELEKAQGEVQTAKDESDALRKDLEQQRVANAFYASNKHTWHNPARALQILDRSDVTIGTDGKVTGLEAAINKLVKSDPYLIKVEGAGAPSGDGKDGKDSKDSKVADREALERKYPALRR